MIVGMYKTVVTFGIFGELIGVFGAVLIRNSGINQWAIVFEREFDIVIDM